MLLNSLRKGDAHMDKRKLEGSMPPPTAVEGMDGKRPWAPPVLKRLNVSLTSAKDDSSVKHPDGGTGQLQHS
jgi:hypothetical protein